jgi:uncharacterized protein (TIGR02246 family)
MTPETPATEVARLLETLARGWNAGSGATYASAFAEDADFINIIGMHARGRDLIARGHDELLSTIFRGTRMTAVVDSVRFLRPDVATVEATLSLQRADGQPFTFSDPSRPPMPHTRAGYVATKERGTWSIAVFRNMVPFARPAAGPVERELEAEAVRG